MNQYRLKIELTTTKVVHGSERDCVREEDLVLAALEDLGWDVPNGSLAIAEEEVGDDTLK